MTKIRNIALTLSATVLIAGTSFAGTITKMPLPVAVEVPTAATLTVNFLGEQGNYLFFEVAVKSGSNKTVSFAVEDYTEGELYTAEFKGDKVQTLKIEKRENQSLDFKLLAGKKTISESFTIMPNIVLAKL